MASCVLVEKELNKEFKVFNALLYKDQPDMQELCIKPINVMYAWYFFPKGPKRGAYELPAQESLVKAKAIITKKSIVTVLDIEHWPLKNVSHRKAVRSARNYLSVVKEIKASVPGVPIGYYGVVPVVDFSRAIQAPSEPAYKKWQVDNDRVKIIADQVDAVFPSLYTISSSPQHWRTRALASLNESRRIAPGKPIYPFVWPYYHSQGGKIPSGTPVEAEYWQYQLEFLKKHTDGLVLWGGYKKNFSKELEWWRITQDFIKVSFTQTQKD